LGRDFAGGGQVGEGTLRTEPGREGYQYQSFRVRERV
jgi:hypothetical protein